MEENMINEETVVRTYADMVYKIAYRYVANPTDADDVFSETFLTYFKKERVFQDEEHRKAWLIRVAINCCNSHFVAPWRRNVDSLSDIEIDDIPDEDEFYKADDSPDVYAEVLKLPQNMREVILLYYYEEMSIREIAKALHTTEVNIKKRLSRARQKLKLELEPEERKSLTK